MSQKMNNDLKRVREVSLYCYMAVMYRVGGTNGNSEISPLGADCAECHEFYVLSKGY